MRGVRSEPPDILVVSDFAVINLGVVGNFSGETGSVTSRRLHPFVNLRMAIQEGKRAGVAMKTRRIIDPTLSGLGGKTIRNSDPEPPPSLMLAECSSVKTKIWVGRTTSDSLANTRHLAPGLDGEPPTSASSSQYPRVGPPVVQVPTA